MQIFISYDAEIEQDRNMAKRLYDDLKAQEGIKPWIDTEDLIGGKDRKREISQAIRESSYFLALMSSESISNIGPAQSELKIALEVLDEFPEDQIFVIPVKINSCKPVNEQLSKKVPVYLFPSYEDGLKRILRSLGSKKCNNSETKTDPKNNNSSESKGAAECKINKPAFSLKSVEDFIFENIVEIRCFKENQIDSYGTGFFISDSLIATCYHCVFDENQCFYQKIQILHQKFEKEAKIAFYSKDQDYAVLYIADACLLLPFPLANEKDIETILIPNVTKVYSYGFCELTENKRNKKVVRATYFAREDYNRDVFTFKVDDDTAIHKGQSGSPICAIIEGNPKPLVIGMLQEDVEEGKYNEDKNWKKMCALPVTEIIDKFNEMNNKIKFLNIEQPSLIDQFKKKFSISSIQIDFRALNKEFGLNLEGLSFYDANNFASIYGGRLPSEEEWLMAIKHAGSKMRILDNTKEWLNPVGEDKKALIMDTKYKCALEHRPDAVSSNYVFRIVKEIKED